LGAADPSLHGPSTTEILHALRRLARTARPRSKRSRNYGAGHRAADGRAAGSRAARQSFSAAAPPALIERKDWKNGEENKE